MRSVDSSVDHSSPLAAASDANASRTRHHALGRPARPLLFGREQRVRRAAPASATSRARSSLAPLRCAGGSSMHASHQSSSRAACPARALRTVSYTAATASSASGAATMRAVQTSRVRRGERGRAPAHSHEQLRRGVAVPEPAVDARLGREQPGQRLAAAVDVGQLRGHQRAQHAAPAVGGEDADPGDARHRAARRRRARTRAACTPRRCRPGTSSTQARRVRSISNTRRSISGRGDVRVPGVAEGQLVDPQDRRPVVPSVHRSVTVAAVRVGPRLPSYRTSAIWSNGFAPARVTSGDRPTPERVTGPGHRR